MIITVKKPIDEIIKKLSAHQRIFLIGCAACATKCQTGGEEAIKCISKELENVNKTVAGFIILDTPCDMRITKRDLVKALIGLEVDAFLVLACGAGIQSIERFTDKPIYPALNPIFTGTTERIGIYHKYCMLCGDCVIDKTGGICPISRCAKSLKNGPCGGVIEGKCETDNQKDCAWVLIYKKMKIIND